MNYRLVIPPHVSEVIRHLPPDIKLSVRAALREIARNPGVGTPLRGDLAGLWKYRVRRFRIVYSTVEPSRTLRIYAVGHRREVYEQVESPATSK